MKEYNFFAGLEEVGGRFGSLFITLGLFAVYGWAKGAVSLDWFQISGYLALFWFLYELLSYFLFKTFRYFAGSKNDEEEIKESIKIAEEKDQV
jgi:hypothetical protein